MKKNILIYLESGVHLFIQSNHAIIYNSLNKEIFKLDFDKNTWDLLKELEQNKKGDYIIIDHILFNEKKELIRELQSKNMLGVIEDTEFIKAPVFIKPVLKLENEPTENSVGYRGTGKNVISYVKEITIYLNTSCKQNCIECQTAFKQFIWCTKNFENHDIEVDKLISFLDSVPEFVTLNLIGGNILLFKDLNILLEYLSSKNFNINLLFHQEIINRDHSIIKEQFKKIQYNLICLSSYPYNANLIKKIDDKIEINKYIFVASSEEEISNIKLFQNEFQEGNYFIELFHHMNDEFIEHYTYIHEDDFSEIAPNSNEIYKQQKMNPLFFGKLYISTEGSIYSNFNGSPLGNINNNVLQDIVQKEINKKSYWFLTRNKVAPCNQCVYNLICPPVSGLELFIGKYNRCSVLTN